MELSRDNEGSQHQIKSYHNGELAIDDKTYNQSLILTSTKIIENWPPQTITELTAQHIEQLTELEQEIILIGTGEKLVFPEAKILAPLINAQIGYEVMDTASACRTFVVLSSEDRKVAAALIIG